MSGRDPFPSVKLENGFTLSGFRPQQRKTFNKPTHIAQTEEPWSRLHDTATLASTRRSVMHEHQAPNDSLDFHLKSVHDQSKDFLRTKNQILYQKETVSKDHRKVEKINQDTQEEEQEKDIRYLSAGAAPQKTVAASDQHGASFTASDSRQHQPIK